MDIQLRFLIVDTYYDRFLQDFFARRPLSGRPYAEQWRALMDQCFGTADFYSLNLNQQGHDAVEVVFNCETLQRQWAKEHGLALPAEYGTDSALAVLHAQVKSVQPDVLYMQNINTFPAPFLSELRPHTRLIVGQTAYPLRPDFDYGQYDLIFTSFPHYVDLFRKAGLCSEYLRIAFEPTVLKRLGGAGPRLLGATFVGGISASHRDGNALLETVATRVPVDFWGYGAESLPTRSAIRRTHHGPVFGLEMYRILAQSRIALNRHIAVSGRFANNMRLYEATGMGALLITDRKDNLPDLFKPGQEVVTYGSAEECAELVQYYLSHEDERRELAAAGQRRTLRDHTYAQRVQEIVDAVTRHLRQPQRVPRTIFAVRQPSAQRAAMRLKAAARAMVAHLPPAVQTQLRSWYHGRRSR